MGDHLTAKGKFQSDKFPTCPEGLVPLSTSDPMAQDLLCIYAWRRFIKDHGFTEDLLEALRADGFDPAMVFPDVAQARAQAQADGEAAHRKKELKKKLIAEGWCMADSDGDCSWEGCPQRVEYKSVCPRYAATHQDDNER